MLELRNRFCYLLLYLTVFKTMRITLNEGARDNALSMFLPFFQKRKIDMNISQLKQLLLNKFVSEAGIHSLSQSGNYYLLGLARYYFNGDLTTNTRLNALYPQYRDNFRSDICTKLDALINILRNAYIDSVGTQFEQPEDFGNLTLDKLLRKYNKKINQKLGIEDKPEQTKTTEVNSDYSAGKNYTYDILYSYNDAKKYNKATEPGAWCITYAKTHYDTYVKRLKIHYIIFRQNGYENIPRKTTEGYTKQKPHDAYGNSLIAVLQSNTSPEPIYITSRWNHGARVDGTIGTEADHAYTKEEFLKVIGCDDSVLQRAFDQWKANAKEKSSVDRKALNAEKLTALRAFKLAQMHLNGGADPAKLFVSGIYLAGNKKGYKCTALVRLKVGDETYTTLMDRKQLFFNEYMVKDSNGYQRCSQGETMVVLKDDDRKNYYIFDLIHHKFLTVDGVFKFKLISSPLSGGYNTYEKYYIVGLSGNQLAMFNKDTMKIVKSPKGASWFEAIVTYDSGSISNKDYHGKIHIPYRIEENDIMKMVYDSSAQEYYYFNCAKGKFINVYKENGFYPSRWQRNASSGYITYENMPNGDGRKVKLQNIYTEQMLDIDGINEFKEISVDGPVVAFRPALKDICYYKDMEINQYLELGGQQITTKTLQIMPCGKWICISLSRDVTGNFWTKCLLYNPYSHNFYSDKISGYYFYIYGSNGNGCKAYNKKTNTIYKIPNPESIDNMLDTFKESVKNNFMAILESIS